MKITVVETSEFHSRSKKLMVSYEREELINYLSDYPNAGDLIQGTGGVRKIRWSRGGMVKSGGLRIVYFYYDDSIPLFLLSVFSKSQKVDLKEAEKRELKRILSEIVREYKQGERNVRYNA